MTTTSRPVIYDATAIGLGTITADDTNVTGDDWAVMNLRDIGVDAGVALSLSAVSDVGTISVGTGVWRGFILRVTAAHDVSLPAVLSAKTYSIGVLFDPANYSTAEGPLSIAVFDKAAITIPAGGAFYTLWEVDRIPSTALAVSTVRTYRHIRGGILYVNSGTLPPPAEVERGTVAVSTQNIYVRDVQGSTPAWLRITSDTGELTSGIVAAAPWANASTAYRTVNGLTSIHLRATRNGPGGTVTSGSSGQILELVMTLPAAARPLWTETGRGVVNLATGVPGLNGVSGFDWRLSPNGQLYIISANPNVPFSPGAELIASINFLR